MKKTTLGIHIFLNLFDCNRDLLKKVPFVKDILDRAVVESGLNKVGESFHQFEPYGVTGVLLLSESHICIHTWPELNTAVIDVFCCSNEERAQLVVEFLVKMFSAKQFEQQVFYR